MGPRCAAVPKAAGAGDITESWGGKARRTTDHGGLSTSTLATTTTQPASM